MKQVTLLGDSIRMGYEPTVRRECAGTAQVWSPEINGGPSARTVEHLDEWIMSRSADIIHFNAGLHDLIRPFDSDANKEPLETYRRNIATILKAAKDTGATVIWATTTPVNERWHHEKKGFDRLEEDVRIYNRAAHEIAVSTGCEINDLYQLVMETGRDSMLRPDGVHFLPEAAETLGMQVAAVLAKHLASPTG